MIRKPRGASQNFQLARRPTSPSCALETDTIAQNKSDESIKRITPLRVLARRRLPKQRVTMVALPCLWLQVNSFLFVYDPC